MKTITKQHIVKRVAELRGVPASQATPSVDAVFQALRESFTKADPEIRVEVRDFGVFEVKRTKAKPHARNPRTGQPIYVPAHRKVHFKSSKLLKQFLSQSLDSDGSPRQEEKK